MFRAATGRDGFDIGLPPAERELLDSFIAIEMRSRPYALHLGHLLLIEGNVQHCINGTVLDFAPGVA